MAKAPKECPNCGLVKGIRWIQYPDPTTPPAHSRPEWCCMLCQHEWRE